MSIEEIKAAIRECAKKVGRAPSLAELNRSHSITQREVIRKFGTYTRALAECGMERRGCGQKVELDALFRDWAGIVRKLGKLPSVAEYQLYSQYSVQPLFTRFGNWRQVPLGLMLYAQEQGLGEEWKDVVEKVREHGRREAMRGGRGKRWNAAGMLEALKAMEKARANGGAGTSGESRAVGESRAGAGNWMSTGNWGSGNWAGGAMDMVRTSYGAGDWAGALRKESGERQWPRILPDRPVYGPSLATAALAHGPTNEMGVLCLFSMMASRLGFVVMRIQAEFPDCEAMRQVGEELWQKVRIEFEYESRNFVKHLHEPDGCDLIVCWRHNWPECPLEVVELREQLPKLP
jgi:hypothetical protein